MADKDLIKLALEQAKAAEDYEENNRQNAVEDLEFIFSIDQWDPDVKNQRGNRPCLNANDLPIFLDQVIGAQRANRTGIKVLPVDSDTDPDKAEIIGGLVRNIEHVSDANVAYDRAIEAAAAGGYMGAIRVVTQFENEDLFDSNGEIKGTFKNSTSAFNQEVRIVPVENALNVLFDPDAKLWHRNDGIFCFSYDDITIDSFEKLHPGKQTIDFSSGELADGLKGWYSEQNKTMRIAEWFLKEDKGTKTVYLVLNEDEEYELVDKKPEDESKILKTREVADFKIVWRKISGVEVLEGPTEIPGRLFPIIPLWGKEININGKRVTRGMFRYIKDVHRMDIYTQSAITEKIALQPKSPYIGTAVMVEGYEDKWRDSNLKNPAILLTNADPQFPGVFPKRQDPPAMDMGLIEQSAQRKADKRDIIGLHQASLGQRSNETSGEAIRQRRAADDSMSFAFHDNSRMAKQQVGRVVIGMIPTIYDTARILQMLGEDGKTQTPQPVNQAVENKNGETSTVDLTIGKHDLVVSTGPGYATQRRETLELLLQLAQYAPNASLILSPIILNLMEVPDSDRIEKVLETLLPPEARAAIRGEEATITPEQVEQAVQEAVEAFKQSEEGQRELLKTEQERQQTEQERLQTEQQRLKLVAETGNLRETVANMIAEGAI